MCLNDKVKNKEGQHERLKLRGHFSAVARLATEIVAATTETVVEYNNKEKTVCQPIANQVKRN